MKLADLRGGKVYCDVNVFYMLLRRDPTYQPIIRDFFKRMVKGEIEVYASILTFDELFYRLLLAQVKETFGRDPLKVLRANQVEAISRCAPDIKRALNRITRLPHLHLVGVDEKDLAAMLDNITAYSLLPRDAIHLAVIQRLRLNQLASDDRDFDRVDWLERHWVFNPVAA